MKSFLKATIVVLLLTMVPLKHWAQTPYRQYADEGIMLNFFEIDNHDFRLFLLYNLDQDDRFIVTPDEQYGMFILTPRSDGEEDDFLETFETIYNNAYADFRLIDKVFLQDLVTQWKASVPPTHFASITMDLALGRAITLNNHCVDSDPFCTSDLIQFQAATTSQTADELEGAYFDDGCIGSSYNPSWYHMRINTPGQFIIHMEGRDPNNGTERDIDFCMWGPFDDPTAPCVSQLTTDKIIDCNYSAHYSEDIYLGFPENEHHHQASHGTVNYHMPETGEYYIAMICNFSRQPCVITFTKTEGSGPGTTDCGILPGIASNSGPYCVGETIQLTVTTQAGATYRWTGPNNFISNEQNPSIPNCTYEMGGTYTCVTAVDGQTTTGTTDVIVLAEPIADFEAPAVCFGETTQFTNTAHTNPIGQEITTYHWDFGDEAESDEQNVTHTYTEAGTYQVTLTVQTGRARCTDEITKTVTVYAQPIADAGEDQSLPYPGLTAQLSGSGGSDSFSYHWEPANMVVNPNNRNTETVILMETQQFVLTVTNPQGGCTSIDTMYVYIGTAPLNVVATASPNALCEGESTQLQINANGGSGDFSYSWTSSPSGFTSNQQSPEVRPTVTTTYTCTVTDNITTEVKQKTITVNVYHDHLNGVATIDENYPSYQCDSIPFVWFGDTTYLMEKGTYSFSSETNTYAQTVQGCDTAMIVTVTKIDYSPKPDKIECIDDGAVFWGAPNAEADTIAVVTNTEFFSFQYTFKVEESEHDECEWNICKWDISKASWGVGDIITERQNGKFYSKCTVYVAEHDDDYVILTATISNGCNIAQRKIYLKSSFLDVDEHEFTTAKVNIVPNPNNGQMRIDFEDMEGPTVVKVFDMTGNPIDAFETNVGTSRYSYDYALKQHAEGIYFFVIANNKRVFIKKVVIIQ